MTWLVWCDQSTDGPLSDAIIAQPGDGQQVLCLGAHGGGERGGEPLQGPGQGASSGESVWCRTHSPALVDDSTILQTKPSQVLPVSLFEKAGNAYYNSIAIVDADGAVLGVYRKVKKHTSIEPRTADALLLDG